MFGLGEEHSGAFVTGATVSNTVGLAVAREWLGERLGLSVSRDGLAALGPVTVLSGTPHSSVDKALSVLGLGRSSLTSVPVLPGGREAVDVDRLDAALTALEGRPAVVVANAGTVNTVDFDDLRAIAALKERHDFWLHVDAAFGGFAALSPAYAHLTEGIDAADSVCVDLHKWLNVPYDAAVQFTRRQDLQVRVFHNASPYLGLPALPDPDFLHLTPENSRRLRASPRGSPSPPTAARATARSSNATPPAPGASARASRLTPACGSWPPSGSTSSASPWPTPRPSASARSSAPSPPPARPSSPRRSSTASPPCGPPSATGVHRRPTRTVSWTRSPPRRRPPPRVHVVTEGRRAVWNG